MNMITKTGWRLAEDQLLALEILFFTTHYSDGFAKAEHLFCGLVVERHSFLFDKLMDLHFGTGVYTIELEHIDEDSKAFWITDHGKQVLAGAFWDRIRGVL